MTFRPALVVALAAAWATGAAAQEPAPLSITVTNRVLNRVDHRLFGQFLERPSWGGERQETGPERAYDAATGGLDPTVVRLMAEMDVPVIRWPGGTDVDHMDWTDMIDNAPGRPDLTRPASVGNTGETVTNRVGMDEGLDAIEAAGDETILVVNLLDGINGTRTVEEAALHAAGLVAYATAPLGAALPEGMPDWPAIRTQNGRAEPWAVRYVQMGNEWHVWKDAAGRPLVADTGAVDPDVKERLFRALDATIAAVHAVAPDAEIIVDGMIDDATDEVRERLGDRVDYLAVHQYHPWGLHEVALDADGDGEAETAVDLPSFVRDPGNADDVWYAWVAPREVDAEGRGVLEGHKLARVVAAGYPAAMTEWNWNGGWWGSGDPDPSVGTFHGRGLGSASYLFEMMRRGDDVALATQSMLVGWYWEIAGIAVPPEGSPYLRPSAVSTAFLGAHHGTERVALEHGPLPTYAQPYRLGGWIFPQAAVALVEPLATRDADSVYVHLLNRSYDAPRTVRLDLAAAGGRGGAVHHVMRGSPRDGPGRGRDPREVAWTESAPLGGGAVVEVVLPPASISTVAVGRGGAEE